MSLSHVEAEYLLYSLSVGVSNAILSYSMQVLHFVILQDMKIGLFKVDFLPRRKNWHIHKQETVLVLINMFLDW